MNETDTTKRNNLKLMARNPRIHELTRIVDLSLPTDCIDQTVSADQNSPAARQITPNTDKHKLSWFSKTNNICAYLNACQPKCINELEELSKSYLQLA